MYRQSAVSLAAILIATTTGCSMPQATTRGQSHNVQTVQPLGGNVQRVHNSLQDQHVFATQASYHSTTGFPGYSGFAGCPHGRCQSGGCPSGHCGHGCGHGCGQHCPHHYHSWSYERPGNLAYPDPGAVGGAVVYPYYTNKGPSDFFRDDCSVLDK